MSNPISKRSRRAVPERKATGRARPTKRRTATGAPTRRKRLPAPERRRRILEAAQTVFVRSGLSGARTREIARAAGVNEATVFSHFASKEEIFEAAVLEPLESIVRGQQEVGRDFAEATDPASMRRLSRASNEQLLASMREAWPLLVTVLFSDHERGRRFYREHLRPMLRRSAEIARTSLLGKMSPVDPELIAIAAFGVHFMVALDHAMREAPLDVERSSTAISDLLMSGFLGER